MLGAVECSRWRAGLLGSACEQVVTTTRGPRRRSGWRRLRASTSRATTTRSAPLLSCQMHAGTAREPTGRHSPLSPRLARPSPRSLRPHQPSAPLPRQARARPATADAEVAGASIEGMARAQVTSRLLAPCPAAAAPGSRPTKGRCARCTALPSFVAVAAVLLSTLSRTAAQAMAACSLSNELRAVEPRDAHALPLSARLLA